ncbi:MAG: PQQ-binding-like beta-propeller repeat protein [Candidatus Hydrogenedentes bacterium]|nr:PQQ-binding-like beta-propeller repeat protein [Candidatus Hydrogenedentota bacterium]
MIRTFCLLVGLCVIPAYQAIPNTWPQFRGPDARGVLDGANLPDTWSAAENVAWQADIPGRGWSSPVVSGGLVFLTSVVSQSAVEEPKKGLYFGGDRPDAPDVVHQWKVYALDLATGALRWERQVHEGKPGTPRHLKNSYASETPVTDGERLYVYFGNLGVYCFDFEGNAVWEKAMPPVKTQYNWGTAASPVLHDGRLYIQNDNEDASYLLALDAKTGAEAWRVAREEGSNWSTPYIWTNSQRTELVTLGSDAVRSYDLAGELLWSLRGMSSITIATPYAEGDLLYFSSGYVGDRKARPIYAVRAGASGDISLAEGETANEWIAWSQPMAAPYNPTTLVYQGRLYVLYDRGLVSCYDAKTGAPLYEGEKLPRGSGYTTSPWAADGKIFCLSEDGVTHVLQAGDQFTLLHSNPLQDDDMGMATPALLPGRLLLRTSARLYAIGG